MCASVTERADVRPAHLTVSDLWEQAGAAARVATDRAAVRRRDVLPVRYQRRTGRDNS